MHLMHKQGTWITDPETGNRICQVTEDIYFGEANTWAQKFAYTSWYITMYGEPVIGETLNEDLHWLDTSGPYWRIHTEDDGWIDIKGRD